MISRVPGCLPLQIWTLLAKVMSKINPLVQQAILDFLADQSFSKLDETCGLAKFDALNPVVCSESQSDDQ